VGGRSRTLDKADASRERATREHDPTRRGIAVEAGKRDGDACSAALDRLAQLRKVVLPTQQHVGDHRTEQWRRTRRASQLLEGEQDFAQPALIGIGTEAGQALRTKAAPNAAQRLPIVAALHRPFDRPVVRKKIADRIAQEPPFFLREAFAMIGHSLSP